MHIKLLPDQDWQIQSHILSYNDKILTISQTRNGCSLSIGGAGIIWGTAFGALSMGAGAAASLVFLLMAEALC